MLVRVDTKAGEEPDRSLDLEFDRVESRLPDHHSDRGQLISTAVCSTDRSVDGQRESGGQADAIAASADFDA